MEIRNSSESDQIQILKPRKSIFTPLRMAGIIEACSEEVEEDSILNEFKLLPHLLKNKLLGIWEESNDPFSNYFHMVDSYTDI